MRDPAPSFYRSRSNTQNNLPRLEVLTLTPFPTIEEVTEIMYNASTAVHLAIYGVGLLQILPPMVATDPRQLWHSSARWLCLRSVPPRGTGRKNPELLLYNDSELECSWQGCLNSCSRHIGESKNVEPETEWDPNLLHTTAVESGLSVLEQPLWLQEFNLLWTFLASLSNGWRRAWGKKEILPPWSLAI